MTLVVPQRSGGRLEYSTGRAEVRVVSGRSILVVPTSIVTVDASGTPTRRLREHYALALATAVEGVFEVPDATAASGWREQQRFTLVRLAGSR
jgi:hypothetical protein